MKIEAFFKQLNPNQRCAKAKALGNCQARHALHVFPIPLPMVASLGKKGGCSEWLWRSDGEREPDSAFDFFPSSGGSDAPWEFPRVGDPNIQNSRILITRTPISETPIWDAWDVWEGS